MLESPFCDDSTGKNRNRDNPSRYHQYLVNQTSQLVKQFIHAAAGCLRCLYQLCSHTGHVDKKKAPMKREATSLLSLLPREGCCGSEEQRDKKRISDAEAANPNKYVS